MLLSFSFSSSTIIKFHANVPVYDEDVEINLIELNEWIELKCFAHWYTTLSQV